MKEDKIVGQIYLSWDYEKFQILPENRGLKHKGGIDEKKVARLQKLIDEDVWVDEDSIVRVNENFQIIQGTHNYVVRRNNKMPIRYVVVSDHRFNNGTTRRQLINNVLGMNTINTSWKKGQVFNAAVDTKCKLALLIQDLIKRHNDKASWTEVMGILTKHEDFFSGYRSYRVLNLDIFCDKDYIEYIGSPGFKAEFDYFLKLNDLFRISHRKGLFFRGAYCIINRCKELLDTKEFMKKLLTMDDSLLRTQQIKSLQGCVLAMIKHYNKAAGKEVVPKTIWYHITSFERMEKSLKKADVEEPTT